MDSFLSFFVVILSWFIFYAFLRNIKHVSERFSYDVALLRFRRSVLNQGTSKLQPCLIYSSYASWVFRENHINAKKRKRKNIHYVPIFMPWYWMHQTLTQWNLYFFSMNIIYSFLKKRSFDFKKMTTRYISFASHFLEI